MTRNVVEVPDSEEGITCLECEASIPAGRALMDLVNGEAYYFCRACRRLPDYSCPDPICPRQFDDPCPDPNCPREL